MSPDDQIMIVATYQQRQSGVNATVVELQRSPPGSTLPSRTVSILLGEFLLVNDTQTDETPAAVRRVNRHRAADLQTPALAKALKRAKAMQPAERLGFGPHYPTPVMCHLRPRHRCRQPLGEPRRIRQHPGQHTPSVLCHVVAADFDPQILRPIADSPHLSGALPPWIIESRQRRFSLRQCTFHIHDAVPLSTT